MIHIQIQTSFIGLLAAGFPTVAFAAAPVFTYGPASNYYKAAAETASPTSNDLQITPTDVSNGIPAEGLDFFLGPDLQASVQGTLDGVCAGETLSKECIDALSVALNQADQYTIESRVVGGGLLLGAAGAAIVGIGIKLFTVPQTEPLPVHFHLESTDVAQIQSLTDDTATLATTTGTENLITVTVAPTSTTSVEPATITTLSADDATGHHSGDVLINLPDQPADLLEQLMRRFGAPNSCKSETEGVTKRQTSGNGPNFNGINNVATFVLPMAAPGHLLQGLGLQALDHLPALKETIDQASLQTVLKAAEALEQFKGVAIGLRDLIAEAVWVAAYDMCVYEQVEIPTLVLEDFLIADDPADDPADDDDDNDGKECTTDNFKKPICSSSQCAGENGICQTGDNTGCECLASTPYYVHPGDKDSMDSSYQVLTQMFNSWWGINPFKPEHEVDGGTLGCGNNPDQGDPDWFVTLEAINSAAADFCEQRIADPFVWTPTEDPSKLRSFDGTFTEDGDQKVVAVIQWLDDGMSCSTLDMGSPDALQLCKSLFGVIINNCDTGNPNGVERWKQGGYYQKDCVYVSINPPGPSS